MSTDLKISTKIKENILSRLTTLYGEDKAKNCLKRLNKLVADYGHDLAVAEKKRSGWNETDAILITYGDVIEAERQPGKAKLRMMEAFVDEYLSEVISNIHILPFFPSSSDAGFSVIDYKAVRDDLGNWGDIERMAGHYGIMADLVINHTSRFSQWFENYEQSKMPGKDYFIEVKPNEDLSEVIRPRDTPLITTVQTNDGLCHVWTTFSDDQIDLDFSNPDVLLEFIDIFLFYCSKGIKIIRLDAIAYIWKKIGTKSIHLEETHQIVKLFRDLVECVDPEITLITETNVPFEENISYFGDGDEAHMIYQFSLPPLLLHAILTENAQYLTKWTSDLPNLPDDCTYFNFTASHDGIGVRPLEGLVPDEEFDYLIKSTKDRGGFVSHKQNADGGQSPYELNITYFDAFEDPGNPRTDLQMKRYMCSQIVMLSLKGVPGIYFHNFTATKNWLDGVLKSGTKRDINRRQYQLDELTELIENPDNINHHIFQRYTQILNIRKSHAAFHPAGKQKVLNIDDSLFTFMRTAPDKSEQILVISNVSGNEIEVKGEDLESVSIPGKGAEDLLSERMLFKKGSLQLGLFQTVWLLI